MLHASTLKHLLLLLLLLLSLGLQVGLQHSWYG
jgi:hypothetical protein